MEDYPGVPDQDYLLCSADPGCANGHSLGNELFSEAYLASTNSRKRNSCRTSISDLVVLAKARLYKIIIGKALKIPLKLFWK